MATETPTSGTGTTDAPATTTTEATGSNATGGTDTGTSTATGADGKPAGDVAQAGKDDTAQAGSTDDGGKAGAATAETKAPENYELTVPEGGRITPSVLARVTEVAKANGWSNEEAQAELNEIDTMTAAAIKEQSEAFLAATKADPDLGGDKFDSTLKLVTLAMDRLAPKGSKDGDAFRKLLDETGFGNHPEVVRMWAKLGKQMQEDRPGSDSGGGVTEVSAAEKLYGGAKS